MRARRTEAGTLRLKKKGTFRQAHCIPGPRLLTIFLVALFLQGEAAGQSPQQAYRLLQEGKLAAAEKAFRALLDTYPNEPSLHGGLGMVYSRMKRYAEAVHEFERVLELKPGDLRAHNNLGVTYLRLDNQEKAIEQFEQVTKLDSDSASAFYNLGLLYLRKANLPRALATLERAHRLRPHDPAILVYLVEIYLDLGRTREAVPLASRLRQILPADTAIHKRVGAWMLERGLASEAIAQFELVRRRESSFPVNYWLAYACYLEANYARVVQLLEPYIPSAAKTPVKLHGLLSVAYLKQGLEEEASNTLKRGMPAAGREPKFLYDISMELLKENLLPLARDLLSYAAARFPDDPDLLLAQARNHHAANRYEEARDASASAVKIRPDFYAGYLALGNSLLELGAYDEALQAYDQALSLNSRDPFLYYVYATALERHNQLEPALLMAQRGIAVDANDAACRFILGKVLERSGRLEDASREYELSSKLQPLEEEAHYRLGLLYKRLQQHQKAEEHLSRFEELKAKAKYSRH